MAVTNLPLNPLTLPEFCQLSADLEEEEDLEAFVRFTLTGVHDGQQAVVDPIRDRLTDDHLLSATRDYDSLLGIDRNCVVHAPLTLYPKTHNWDTLTKKIFIKFGFTNALGPHHVPVHKIPNIFIGKWNVHNTLRVLITGLYKPERLSSRLEEDEERIFYEQGFYPAVRDLMEARGDDWPPDYRSETFRATNARSNTIPQSKMLPRWHVFNLADSIRTHLRTNNVPWADGIYIYHQIQGTKNTSSHSLNVESAEQALTFFLHENNLHQSELQNGNWYIDVGMESTSDSGECLAWRSDSHSDIVAAITGISDAEARRITTLGSSQYVRDMVSHMPAISGCRIVPGKRGEGPLKVRYLQLYTTDKSLTARKNGHHHGTYITGPEILKGKSDKYLNGLYETYRQAAGINVSHARAEVRVPLEYCLQPFIDFDTNALRDSLVSFPSSVWWGLRAYRCLAMGHLIMAQMEGPPELRVKKSALLLTAAAPWFLNSLHCTPDTQYASRNLLTAILPHVPREGADRNILPYNISTRSRVEDEDEDDGIDSEDNTSSDESGANHVAFVVAPSSRTAPSIPFGLLFLRPINMGAKYPVPRFNNGDGMASFISDRTFQVIFGIGLQAASVNLLKQKIMRSKFRRIPNKTRHTPRFTQPTDEPLPLVFDLSRKGLAFEPPPADEGSDVEMEDPDDGLEPPILQQIDAELTEVWYNFLLDVTDKSANRRAKYSYCKLTKSERKRVNDETYRNHNLAAYFVDCQWKIATEAEWLLCFDHMWPEVLPPPEGAKTQNYDQCSYLDRWYKVIDRSTPHTFRKIRKAFKKKFDTLYWMPQAQSDRLWYTKFDQRFQKSSGIERGRPSPRVLINPQFVATPADRPTWTVD